MADAHGTTTSERNGHTESLFPQHEAEMLASGLSGETVRENGIYSTGDKGRAARLLHWDRLAHDRVPAIIYRFRHADGSVNGYHRLKFDHPRTEKSGKVVKYESPKGEPNRAYFPIGVIQALADPTIPLGIVEGEKKSLKATQDGFPFVGITGVYAWQKARPGGKAVGPRQLIPDLDGIAWECRPVYICFDSDVATNRDVQWAEYHLAVALQSKAAAVKVIRLPPGPNGQKVGLDDFLVAHGPDAFRELMEQAAEPMPPRAPERVVEADNDPHRLARVVRKGYEDRFECRLVYWSQQFHEFVGPAYRTIPDPEMKALANVAVKNEADRLNLEALRGWVPKGDNDKPPAVMQVSGRLVGDVIGALGGYTLQTGLVVPPAWLGGVAPFPADEILACRSGLIHLPSLVVGRDDFLVPPTPRFFTFNALDYDFALDAPPPTAWLDFLGQLWSDDPTSIDALQEWLGYLLLPDTKQQKILLLVGPRRSGKGTIARVLRRLVGPENVAGPTLGSLGTNFGLWPLFGKSVAVISDARLSGRTDSAVVTERLLSISGEDTQTIDRKYLTPVTAKLNTRLVILTNELPRLSDSSGALAGRLIVLRFKQSWYGKEDTKLSDRLCGELPGILLWAIEGWRRLRERGRLEQPKSGKQLADDMEDLSSPAGMFVRECCQVGPGHEVEVQLLFSRWRQWCDTKGRKEPGNEQMFGRDLRAAVPGVDTRNLRKDGGRVRVYAGIRLCPLTDGLPD